MREEDNSGKERAGYMAYSCLEIMKKQKDLNGTCPHRKTQATRNLNCLMTSLLANNNQRDTYTRAGTSRLIVLLFSITTGRQGATIPACKKYQKKETQAPG
jgi:hypothetical protein